MDRCQLWLSLKSCSYLQTVFMIILFKYVSVSTFLFARKGLCKQTVITYKFKFRFVYLDFHELQNIQNIIRIHVHTQDILDFHWKSRRPTCTCTVCVIEGNLSTMTTFMLSLVSLYMYELYSLFTHS